MGDRSRTSHRRVLVPPYRTIQMIDGVWVKPCRWCQKPLTKPDGTIDGRRNWHPECAEIYLLANNPGHLRHRVRQRDHGVCSTCGRASHDEWDADHIVPLIDGGGMGLDNVQTLCRSCHAAKTAAENSARMRGRAVACGDQATFPELSA